MRKRIIIERQYEDIPMIAKAISKVKGVKAVYLFGSYATGKVHVNSDIDLCVFADKLSEDAKHKIMRFYSDNLDIGFFNMLPIAVRYKVFSEGKAIEVNDALYVKRAKLDTLRKYLEFKDSLMRLCWRKIECIA